MAKMVYIDNFDDPTSLIEVDVFKNDGFFWDNHYSVAHVFPLSAKEEVIAIATERKKLKDVYDDSVKLIFQLRNKVSRGEYK